MHLPELELAGLLFRDAPRAKVVSLAAVLPLQPRRAAVADLLGALVGQVIAENALDDLGESLVRHAFSWLRGRRPGASAGPGGAAAARYPWTWVSRRPGGTRR